LRNKTIYKIEVLLFPLWSTQIEKRLGSVFASSYLQKS
jgi:hypothetical protein